MRNEITAALLSFVLAVLLVPAVCANADRAHRNLYTQPDSAATGGITGRIERPSAPILQILAIPSVRPEKVYRGDVTGSDRRSFRFTGLPMDRYDLVVFYNDNVYEGLRLQRGEGTLTAKDRQQIEEIIQRSEPFFDIKVIHRMDGETGRGNKARAFCTFARSRRMESAGLRRTHKLVMLQQVGPGWQIARTRDLYPIDVDMDDTARLRPAHHYSPELGSIRVTGSIRDVGSLSL